MKQLKVGVQAMMLKEEFASIGAYETLKKVSEIGYRCVEISQIPMTPANVQSMKKAQEEFGIKIASLSAGVTPNGPMDGESIATHFRKIVSDCRTLDCRYLRIGMLPMNCMSDLDAVLHFCKMAEIAAQKLKDEGIDLYYHNHHVEFHKYDGKYLLDIIRENCPTLGFELDVHWVHRGGEDPVRIINRYAGKVKLIHLKDYRIGVIPKSTMAEIAKGNFGAFGKAFAELVEFAELGEGNLDIPACIEAGKAAGAEYFFIEQDQLYGRSVYEALTIDRDNLAKMGYEIV